MKPYTEEQIDLTVATGKLITARRALEQTIREFVEEMRDQEMSWAQIGLALGTTGQSAWERYSGHQRDSEIPSSGLTPLPGMEEPK